MRYYIIAGEASGDLHGSNLVKALRQKDPASDIRAWGGDLMTAAGAEVVKHFRDLAFMGFAEVVMNLKTILGNFKFCKADILSYQPDVLILIDYPGFNLRMAKWAKRQGIRIFYYISPQLWAWHSSRVHQIKKDIDQMFVILPFEKVFYKKYDYDVNFVGHPLLDVIADLPIDSEFLSRNQFDSPIIALLPGSRKQEIKRMLDIMLNIVPDFPDYQFIIAGAPSIPEAYYQSIISEQSALIQNRIKFITQQTYPLLQHAKAALVTSGTATLETGLFKVPQVVCYQGNKFSYQIAKRLINVKYISLVNLILDQPLVTELIQSDFNALKLKEELNKLLLPKHRESLRIGYDILEEDLGKAGASERTADMMFNYLEATNRNV